MTPQALFDLGALGIILAVTALLVGALLLLMGEK